MLRKQVLRAKEDTVKEFRNSNAFLYDLGGCFADSFNDCLRQVKASFPDLDLSQIFIDALAQTPTQSINPEGTNELFANNPTPGTQGDGEAALQDDPVKSVEDETCPLEKTKTIYKENDKEAVVDQP